MLGVSRWFLASAASLSALACGGLVESDGSAEDDVSVAVGGGGTIPPLPTNQSPWQVGGGAAAVGGVAAVGGGGLGSGGTGTGGELEAENVDCTGDFGEPELLFEDVGWVPQALSPTRDGLEIFYARSSLETYGPRRFAVRTRGSLEEDFSDPIPLVDLDEACALAAPDTEPSALDVSGDALRLYIGCNAFAGAPYEQGPMLLASRPDRNSPFVVQPNAIGLSGISLGLTKDELEGFGSSLDPAVPQIIHYTRPSIDVPFDAGVPVLGGVEMLNPEPAPDGLYLLGIVSDEIPGVKQIGFSIRRQKGAAFSAPSTEGMPPPGMETDDYSPALTADCRQIYFLRIYSEPNYHAEVMVSRR